MNKLQYIFLSTLLIFATVPAANTQELPDINTVSRSITQVFKTDLGIAVFYSSSKIDVEAVYLPSSWFIPINIRNQLETSSSADVYAKLVPTLNNINTPMLTLTYYGTELRFIDIYVTKEKILEVDRYLPPDFRAVDIETKFKAQEALGYVVIK